ncbi:hypothetical protein [Rufibacter latericius]|uniref:DUF3899 domain-containing protein n=1 Tax=Rufibacter latericius TaxID=2487040 RepID=A0A3M9M925_9BACT|nr:hypothetical protein [Rufibacter latericius]RNI22059.1 hypothetical protein EFB08_23285 [Rufibacter latericius]
MNAVDLLIYSAFAYSFIVGAISFSLQSELGNPLFFKRCLIASAISFTLGVVLELTNAFNLERGTAIIIMSISIIYLGYYYLLRMLFIAWKGTEPYITSSTSSIDGKPLNGYWTKYPKNRKVMWEDYLFSFAQGLIPIFTILALLFF